MKITANKAFLIVSLLFFGAGTTVMIRWALSYNSWTLREQLIEISFPTTEMLDPEIRARAYLGVKHGSTFDTLGIPNSEIAGKLGFGNYRKLRLVHAAEMEKYPELIPTVDQEGLQEKREAEKGRAN